MADSPPTRQLAFDFWDAPALVGLEDQLRAAIAEALKCPLSRDQVADLIALQTGLRINRGHLDAWTAPSKQNHRIPAVALVALCRILRTDKMMQILAGALGGRVLFGADLERAELAALEDERARLAREIGRRRRVAEARGAGGGR